MIVPVNPYPTNNQKDKEEFPTTGVVGREGETMERVAKELHKKIAKDKPKNIRLWFEYFPQLDHGDTLHLAVYAGFQKIFSAPTQEPDLSPGGSD